MAGSVAGWLALVLAGSCRCAGIKMRRSPARRLALDARCVVAARKSQSKTLESQ